MEVERVHPAAWQPSACASSRRATRPRHWACDPAMLEAATPRAGAVRRAATFEALAAAEARVHGVALDEVHFHEVGAIDSIVDVVGVCAGLHALGVERCGLPGRGRRRDRRDLARHAAGPRARDGRAARRCPHLRRGRSRELTTPTGAALLRALARFGPMPPMVPSTRLRRGHARHRLPNVCQLTVGEPRATGAQLTCSSRSHCSRPTSTTSPPRSSPSRRSSCSARGRSTCG